MSIKGRNIHLIVGLEESEDPHTVSDLGEILVGVDIELEHGDHYLFEEEVVTLTDEDRLLIIGALHSFCVSLDDALKSRRPPVGAAKDAAERDRDASRAMLQRLQTDD